MEAGRSMFANGNISRARARLSREVVSMRIFGSVSFAAHAGFVPHVRRDLAVEGLGYRSGVGVELLQRDKQAAWDGDRCHIEKGRLGSVRRGKRKRSAAAKTRRQPPSSRLDTSCSRPSHRPSA